MIVDYALYQNGLRYKEPSNLGELISKAKTEGGFVWLGLAEPTAAEFDKIMGDFWVIVTKVAADADPDVFVMGGGMSNVDELYEDLPRALAKCTFSTVFHTPILRNVHGDASGVRGAAWLWKD